MVAGLAEPPVRASPECYAVYLELAVYNVERGRADFLHQEAVDAYAAQHPGAPGKPISTWFALVGLHLAVDQGRQGHEVQRAHMVLGRRRRTWPVLPPPLDLTGSTASDVMHAPAGDERDDALLSWAGEVWRRWEPVHQEIATLCAGEGL